MNIFDLTHFKKNSFFHITLIIFIEFLVVSVYFEDRPILFWSYESLQYLVLWDIFVFCYITTAPPNINVRWELIYIGYFNHSREAGAVMMFSSHHTKCELEENNHLGQLIRPWQVPIACSQKMCSITGSGCLLLQKQHYLIWSTLGRKY